MEGILTASWTAPADLDVGGYVGRARIVGDPSFTYQRFPATPTNFTIVGLPMSTVWEGQIAAVDVWGNQGSYTSLVNFILPDGNVPAGPTDLTATPGFRSVVLKMTGSTDSRVIGYEGWRATNSAMTANSVSAVVGLITTYVDADLDPTTTYFYKVRAIARNTGLKSVFTDLVFATPNTVQSGSVAAQAILTSNVNTQAITTTRRQLLNSLTDSQTYTVGQQKTIQFTHNLGVTPAFHPLITTLDNIPPALWVARINNNSSTIMNVYNNSGVTTFITTEMQYW